MKGEKTKNFTISGPKSLLQAFVNEIEFDFLSENTKDYPFFVIVLDAKRIEGNRSAFKTNFNLPEEWHQAIDYFKTNYEVINYPFKAGDYVSIINTGCFISWEDGPLNNYHCGQVKKIKEITKTPQGFSKHSAYPLYIVFEDGCVTNARIQQGDNPITDYLCKATEKEMDNFNQPYGDGEWLYITDLVNGCLGAGQVPFCARYIKENRIEDNISGMLVANSFRPNTILIETSDKKIWRIRGNFREASKEEVEAHFITEAKKRGIVKGVSVKYLTPPRDIRKCDGKFFYNPTWVSGVQGFGASVDVYWTSKEGWVVEVVKEKEMYFGEVKFIVYKDYAISGYGKITKEELKTFLDWFKNPPTLLSYPLNTKEIKKGDLNELQNIYNEMIY